MRVSQRAGTGAPRGVGERCARGELQFLLSSASRATVARAPPTARRLQDAWRTRTARSVSQQRGSGNVTAAGTRSCCLPLGGLEYLPATCGLEGALCAALCPHVFARPFPPYRTPGCRERPPAATPRARHGRRLEAARQVPLWPSPPAPAEPTARGLSGTMLESIRVTGECWEAWRSLRWRERPASSRPLTASMGWVRPEAGVTVGFGLRCPTRRPEQCGVHGGCSGKRCAGKRKRQRYVLSVINKHVLWIVMG